MVNSWLRVCKSLVLAEGVCDSENAGEADALASAMIGNGDEVADFASFVSLAEKRDLVIHLGVDSGCDDFGVVRSLFHDLSSFLHVTLCGGVGLFPCLIML